MATKEARSSGDIHDDVAASEDKSTKKTEEASKLTSSSVLHRGQDALDLLDIRLGPTRKWKNDIPELPLFDNDDDANNPDDNSLKRFAFGAAAIPPGNTNHDPRLVALGGWLVGNNITYLKSVRCLQFKNSGYQNQSSNNSPSTAWGQLPSMIIKRAGITGVFVDGKLYAIGGGAGNGGNARETFEVLDLDNVQAGWKVHRMPDMGHVNYFQSVSVGNRYIFVLARGGGDETTTWNPNAYYLYDTKTGDWKRGVKSGMKFSGYMDLASISIPGEGSYVVVRGGRDEFHFTFEAFHFESKEWIQLPDLPNECNKNKRKGFALSSLGNRFILLAGGCDYELNCTSSVMAFDWKTKDWLELPSLTTPQWFAPGQGVYVPGNVNKWIVTGGFETRSFNSQCRMSSLEIAPGIGWAKEKLLLLCFRGKAQIIKKSKKKPCLLEGLDGGIFANILTYLIVPFRDEIDCKGSIFAVTNSTTTTTTTTIPSSSSSTADGKRKALNDEQLANKKKKSN